MGFQESASFILLVLCFLNRESVSRTMIIQFLIHFIKYLIGFIFKISCYYFKFILLIFAIYKAFFFTNFVPSIIQIALTFHYSFNYIWDVYLLMIVYSTFIWCFPFYLYKYNNEKIYNISVKTELNAFLFFCFFYILNLENCFACLTNLFYFDFFILNKKTFLKPHEYSEQTESYTAKALEELAKFARENYDDHVYKIKATKR